MRASRGWHSSAEAIRYAVDTGSIPPTRRRLSLPFAKPLLLGGGAAAFAALAFFVIPAARSSANLAGAAAHCETPRSAWRSECQAAKTEPEPALAAGRAPAAKVGASPVKRTSTGKRDGQRSKMEIAAAPPIEADALEARPAPLEDVVSGSDRESLAAAKSAGAEPSPPQRPFVIARPQAPVVIARSIVKPEAPAREVRQAPNPVRLSRALPAADASAKEAREPAIPRLARLRGLRQARLTEKEAERPGARSASVAAPRRAHPTTVALHSRGVAAIDRKPAKQWSRPAPERAEPQPRLQPPTRVAGTRKVHVCFYFVACI